MPCTRPATGWSAWAHRRPTTPAWRPPGRTWPRWAAAQAETGSRAGRRPARPRRRPPASWRRRRTGSPRRRRPGPAARGREEAARAQQDARTRLAELTGRIGELGRLLGDAPDEAEITAQLARRDELEAAAADAEQHLLKARSDRGGAEQALAGLERAESAARVRLSAARDPLVVLGAPALDDTSLLTAWTALANWAAGAASAREQGIAAARQRVGAARSNVET